MPPTAETQLLELERQVWKARAQAKQKWLERTLVEPARSPRQSERRAMWIDQALNVVKRRQEQVKHQSALMDAYAEHLNALEMTLMSAVERKSGAGMATQSAEIDPVTCVKAVGG